MTENLLSRVRARGLVTEQEIVEWILGERPAGSWWSHPRAKEAYGQLVELNEETELLSLKLVDGKQTLVHRALWPALVRLQREATLWPELSPKARELLGAVRKRSETTGKGAPRLELERTLRVVATHVHTEKGHHEVVLVPFEEWIPDDVAREAEKLSLDEAKVQLARAGYVHSAAKTKTPVVKTRASSASSKTQAKAKASSAGSKAPGSKPKTPAPKTRKARSRR